MTNLEAKDLIKRLCNYATKILSFHGININVMHNIVIDFSSIVHSNILYIMSNDINKVFLCRLGKPMQINSITKITNCCLFDDSLNDTKIDWCLLLDELIKNAGTYVEFDHPNKNYWQAKIDVITNMANSEYLDIQQKYGNDKVRYKHARLAFDNKFYSLIRQAVDDMQYHAPPIKIFLVPSQISNIEEFMIWLDINDV